MTITNSISRLQIMHNLYGALPECRCTDCCNLCRPNGYSKCRRYGVNESQATDWNSRGIACGKFNVPLADGEQPLVLLGVTRRASARDMEQLPGQVGMEDNP